MVKVFNFDNNPTEFSANTYVIGKIGGNCLIVDLGSTNDDIIEYIDSHYERVAGILLTHAHFDHIRGLTKFLKHYRNQYDIPVFLHPADIELMTNPDINFSNMAGESVSVNIPTENIEDGQVINLKDFNVCVIHTPFHTKGSVCYLFEDDNALFTGDTLFKGSIGRIDLPSSDPKQVPYSLEKLRQLSKYLVVYPGHGPVTRLEDEINNNPYFKY